MHEINCWRRTGLSGICFCFSIPFFVLELYAIKARSLFGFRTQKTGEYLKSRENYSSIAFNKCKISDNPCPLNGKGYSNELFYNIRMCLLTDAVLILNRWLNV